MTTEAFPVSATAKMAPILLALFCVSMLLIRPAIARAQQQEIVWSAQEKPIADQLHGLRKLPDDVRGKTNKDLALQIRQLPATPNKVRLAVGLANRSTEGDFGRDSLQAVTTTLNDALREQPQPDDKGEPAAAYIELAQLERYEHMEVSLDAPAYKAAMARLVADDQRRQQADLP